jgi:hypothetical protein
MAILAGTASTRFMPALNDPEPALSRVALEPGHAPPRLARKCPMNPGSRGLGGGGNAAAMSQSKETTSPSLDTQNALILAGMINRFAASFDAKEALSLPEVRVLVLVIVQVMNVLVRAYPDELQYLMDRAMQADDEPDDSN